MSSLKSSKGVPQPPPEVTAKMDAWKRDIKDNALKAINETMAQKCLALTHRLETDAKLTADPKTLIELVSLPSTEEVAAPPSKKRKLDENGSAKSDATATKIDTNESLSSLMEALKKEALEFIDTIHVIRIFIQLNVPRIEDGNNFGVSVQEEVLNELTRSEDSAFAVVDQATKYFISRGKLLSKVVKYPGLEDYRRSVLMLDEKQHLDVRLAFKDLRNSYAILDDIVQKNIEKLLRPRSSHTTSMF